MKIVNIVVISIMLFLSVGVVSGEGFADMDNIVTDDCTPPVEFRIDSVAPQYICNLYINDTPSGVGIADNNILTGITCNRTLEEGMYVYYISAFNEIHYNSSRYTLQITSAPQGSMVEAIGYLGDGFQHIGDSAESLLLWGIIFCAIVILLGMIAMFIKALRG